MFTHFFFAKNPNIKCQKGKGLSKYVSGVALLQVSEIVILIAMIR